MSYFENVNKVDAWHEIRRSRFTSSVNYKLLPAGGSIHPFAKVGMTYIEEKVIELTTKMYERPELEEVESLLHGKAHELPAFERYVTETKNYSMTYIGDENPIFIECEVEKLREESGGTPDFANILDSGVIDMGGEIKCPKNPAYHFRRLDWKDQWDLKENYIEYYTQVQDLMRLTGAHEWDFVSYDERQLAKSKQIIIIPVKRDNAFIDNLELRIYLAVKEKYKLLSKRMKVELKNRTEFLNFVKAA